MRDGEFDRALESLRQFLLDTKDSSRRDFLRGLAKVGTGSVLLSAFTAPILQASAQTARPVTTMGYGGIWQRALYEAFFNALVERGMTLSYQTPMDFAKLRAMNQTNTQQIDFTNLGGLQLLQAYRLNMVGTLDWSKIDRSQLSQNQLSFPNAVGGVSNAHMFIYNKRKWPGDDHPKTWADFWDVQRFPGRRAMRRDLFYPTIEQALLADGLRPNDPGFYPLDLDRAFRSLERIKPHVRVWWTTNTQASQLCEREEVDLCTVAIGHAVNLSVTRNLPWGIVYNQAVFTGDVEGWVMMRNAPNPEGAHRALDWVGRAEPQAIFARSQFYGPSNQGAYQFLADDVARLLPSHPDNVRIMHRIDFNWWADHTDAVGRRFEEWLQS